MMTSGLPKAVAANIGNFTGRTWLLPTVLEWFERYDDRMFILTGGPGTGKSMVAAWLAGAGPLPADAKARAQLEQIRSQAKATHFCVAASGSTSPKELARNIAEQLTCSVPGFGDALAATLRDQVTISAVQEVGTVATGGTMTGVYIEHLDLSGLSEELSFNRALREPLKELYDNGYAEPTLLLVDSLDEAATYAGKVNIVHLLAKLADLPRQVRLLATTRPDPRVLKYYREITPFDLVKDAPADVDDVRLYAYERLYELDDKRRTGLADRIARAAEGIFLYAHLVLGDLLPRLSDFPDLATIPLPKGLGGLYHRFLNRELGKDEDLWYKTYKPLLGLIAVAQGEGMSRTQIERIVGEDVERPLRVCKQYLDGALPEGPFRPFHKSFADFLLTDEENVDYHVDGTQMHRKIVDYYRGPAPTWEDVDWGEVDDYGLFHLIAHLYPLKEDDKYRKELYGLICRSFMREKQARTFSHRAFGEDVALAVEVTAAEEPPNLVDVARVCVIYATLGSLATNVPPEALGVLARAGQVAKARGYASLIQDKEQQLEAYRLIGEALLAEKEVEEAREVFRLALAVAETGKFGYKRDKACALSAVAVALCQAGDKGKAAEVAGQALTEALAYKDTFWQFKVGALNAVADAFARAGDKSKAAEVANRALEVANGALTVIEAIEDWLDKASALGSLARALAQAGIKDKAAEVANRALPAVETIKSEWYRAEVLGVIAQTLARAGDKDRLMRVLAAAKMIEAKHSKALALNAVAQALARVGDKEEAAEVTSQTLAVAEAIEDRSLKVRALSEVAVTFKVVGDDGKTARVADEALAMAETIEDDWHKVDNLCAIAETLYQAGVKDKAEIVAGKALEVAEAIEDKPAKEIKLKELADFLARAGEFEKALAAAEAIEDNEYKASALTAVAESLARAGIKDKAADAANRALAAAEASEDWSDKVYALGAVAWALAQVGDKDKAEIVAGKALEVAEAIEDKPTKEIKLKELADFLARAGEFEKALAAAEAIEDNKDKASALTAVAESLARAGIKDKGADAANRALAAAEAITTKWKKVDVLSALARVLAQAGDKDKAAKVTERASAVAETIEDKWGDKAVALGSLAQALAHAEVKDKAAEVAGRALTAGIGIEDERSKRRALGAAAHALAQAGEFEKALVAAEAIEGDFQYKSFVLKDVALTSAQVGEFEKALAVAETIEYNWFKAGVLNAVAEAFAQAGDKDKAADVANQALAAAELIKDGRTRADTLVDVAQALAQAGDKDKGAKVANRALAVAEAIEDNEDKASALTAVARALDQAGRQVAGQRALIAAFTAARLAGRVNVFVVILNGATALAAIDQGQTLWQVYKGIQEVDAWWGM